MSDASLDRERILRCLEDVADLLGPSGPVHEVVMVGGSLLALRDLRRSTLDVDSVRRMDGELIEAVAAVAAEHGLAPRWLNDSSATFRPATLRDSDCQVELRRGRLLVLGAPLEQVFLMKLYASRASDLDDLISLWPHCRFTSHQEVVDNFYEAYPFEESDPYLVDHVAAIAAASIPDR